MYQAKSRDGTRTIGTSIFAETPTTNTFIIVIKP